MTKMMMTSNKLVRTPITRAVKKKKSKKMDLTEKRKYNQQMT